MKFREHRGGLDESMETCVEIANYAQLLDHIGNIFKDPPLNNFKFDPRQVHISSYSMSPDTRIGWEHTYIVTIDGYGVLGFTDGPFPLP
jgi:hypothetical protein